MTVARDNERNGRALTSRPSSVAAVGRRTRAGAPARASIQKVGLFTRDVRPAACGRCGRPEWRVCRQRRLCRLPSRVRRCQQQAGREDFGLARRRCHDRDAQKIGDGREADCRVDDVVAIDAPALPAPAIDAGGGQSTVREADRDLAVANWHGDRPHTRVRLSAHGDVATGAHEARAGFRESCAHPVGSVTLGDTSEIEARSL